jgi:hypothetical protein
MFRFEFKLRSRQRHYWALERLEPRRLLSVYFVANTGSNQAAGTFQAPFQTIQHAASIAEPGDLVLIRGGIYRETETDHVCRVR